MLLTLERPAARAAETAPAPSNQPAPLPQGSLFVSSSGHRLVPHLAVLGVASPNCVSSGIQLSLFP